MPSVDGVYVRGAREKLMIIALGRDGFRKNVYPRILFGKRVLGAAAGQTARICDHY